MTISKKSYLCVCVERGVSCAIHFFSSENMFLFERHNCQASSGYSDLGLGRQFPRNESQSVQGKRLTGFAANEKKKNWSFQVSLGIFGELGLPL